MTFGAVFPRVLRPVFGPGLAAATAANWWEAGSATGAVGAYQATGVASQPASYVNLANPGTYNLTSGSAPGWNAATGWTCAGSHYLDTSIVPSSSAWSYVIRFANYNTSFVSRAVYGQLATGHHLILPYSGGAVDYRNGGTRVGTAAPGAAGGVLAISDRNVFRDGVDEGITLSGAAAATYSIYLGAINRGGSITNYLYGDILAFAIYNTALTAPQVAAISTAMAAL